METTDLPKKTREKKVVAKTTKKAKDKNEDIPFLEGISVPLSEKDYSGVRQKEAEFADLKITQKELKRCLKIAKENYENLFEGESVILNWLNAIFRKTSDGRSLRDSMKEDCVFMEKELNVIEKSVKELKRAIKELEQQI